jgi:hypothetical protein
LADTLALKSSETLAGSAENATLLVLLDNDTLAFKRNLHTIALLNLECAAHLFWDDKAAELVDTTDNTSGFPRGVLL